VYQPDSPEDPAGEMGQGKNRANGSDNGGACNGGWQENAALLARISGIGWFVVGSIGAGIGAGWLLDRQFGTEPVLILIGLLLGVIGAFAGMIRMLNAFGKQDKRR
jgi:hypothetical protein